MREIPFSYIGTHMMQIAVKVNGEELKFLIDTGIGLTVISKNFVQERNLKQKGTFSGKRMSGQELAVPLIELDWMDVGGIRTEKVVAGLFDMSLFPPYLSEIKGIISPSYFSGKVLTFDYMNRFIHVSEEPIMDGTLGKGVVVPAAVEYDGPAVSIFVNGLLPNGRVVKLEVDTGSDVLILNSKYMEELGISPDDESVKVFEGADETSFKYKRYFAEVAGRMTIENAPDIFQDNPRVVFQEIIHDGLLGNDFLKRYTVAFDLNNSKMLFYKT